MIKILKGRYFNWTEYPQLIESRYRKTVNKDVRFIILIVDSYDETFFFQS